MIWRKCLILVMVFAVCMGSTAFGKTAAPAEELEELLESLTTWETMIAGGAGSQEILVFYEDKLKDHIEQLNPQITRKIRSDLEKHWWDQGDRQTAVKALLRVLRWIDYELINDGLTKAADALQNGDSHQASKWLGLAEQRAKQSFSETLDVLDKKYGSFTRDNMETVLFPALNQAIEKEQAASFRIFAKMLDKLMLKLFLMDMTAVMDEVQRLLNEGNLKQAERTLALVSVSYEPLQQWLSKETSRPYDRIVYLLSHPAQFDAKRTKKELVGVINNYIQRNLKEVFRSSSDRKELLEQVSEGIAAVSILETVIDDLHGPEQFAQIQQYGESYFAAVKENNLTEAEKYAFRMLKELSRIKGVFFTVGSDRITADGRLVETGQRAAYVDPVTERMMTSIRFIGEALAADVKYDAPNKKIKLLRDELEIEMTVGSRVVMVNGRTADRPLDQSVTLKDDRAYIPLRGTAELLGHDVYWYRGEVVIN
jgi:hypothetical protein